MRNTVILAMFEAFGAEPRLWFASVLLTHLLNALLLHRVIHRFTCDRWLACVGATLWATCPALEGALGWYSVYGQVLLTTLVLIVLARLADTVVSGRPLSTRGALGWSALLVLGGCSFGTGLGIAAAFPLVATLALPPQQRSARVLAVLVVAAVLLFATYAAVRAGATGLEPRARELLSPGAILRAIPEVLALEAQLLVFGASTLLVGFLGLDPGCPGAIAAIAAAACVVVVAAAWLTSDAAGRRLLLALTLLVVAAYGAIAAGRATVLEAVRVPLSLAAAWPRYHYLPLALLALLQMVALGALRARSRSAQRVVYGAGALWMAARLLVLATRPVPIDLHDAERMETEAVLRSIRAAVAATPPGATVVIENKGFPAAGLPGRFPGWAGVFVIHFPENAVDGRPVRFVAGEGDWQLAQERGGRIAALVTRRASH